MSKAPLKKQGSAEAGGVHRGSGGGSVWANRLSSRISRLSCRLPSRVTFAEQNRASSIEEEEPEHDPGAVQRAKSTVITGSYWVPHPTKVFSVGKRASDQDKKASPDGKKPATWGFLCEGGEIVQVPEADCHRMDPVTDMQLQGIQDVKDLDTMSDGAVLETVRRRYMNSQIYTAVDKIIIALNPFERATPDMMQKRISMNMTGELNSDARDLLRGSQVGLKTDGPTPRVSASKKGALLSLPPHIYKIGWEALGSMLKTGKDQAVLISGESGAGKTESTKLCLGYIATMAKGNSSGGDDPDNVNAGVSIEDKILSTNPILESFGNAKTVRNNNSSRFGKWIELDFNGNHRIEGSKITNYLLEVTRVVNQAKEERNFHIFYQIVQNIGKKVGGGETGMPTNADNLLAKTKIQAKEPKKYEYLKHSMPELPEIDDLGDYRELLEAFTTLGVDDATLEEILSIAAGVLHLGNCEFRDATVSQTDGSELTNEDALKDACANFGMEGDAGVAGFEKALTFRPLKVMGKIIETPNTKTQAENTRNSLAKLFYGKLFNWLVNRCNDLLGLHEHDGVLGDPGSRGSLSKARQSRRASMTDGTKIGVSSGGGVSSRAEKFGQMSSIGILDIAGFESFDINSLEQLFINLSNENLQQHFNSCVFKQELAVYQADGVSVANIDFHDNADVLELIQGHGGILWHLNEELKLPKATNETFVTKVDTKFGAFNDARAKNKNAGAAALDKTSSTDSATERAGKRYVKDKFGGSHIKFGIMHFAGKPAGHEVANEKSEKSTNTCARTSREF